MKQSFNLRLLAILWVWLLGFCVSTPVKAQFDEPSRNQWFVDASFGFLDGLNNAVPEISYHNKSYDIDHISGFDYLSSVFKFGLSFGLNRRLFHNFYAGVRIGYRYSEYKVQSGHIYYYHRYGQHNYPEEMSVYDLKMHYHLLNLPIEIGYNHTYSNRSGLNVYISFQPGCRISSSCSMMLDDEKYGPKPDSNFKIEDLGYSKPGLCLDSAAGLRYFIRHVSIGAAYHYPLNYNQKCVGNELLEASLGYRF